MSRKKSTKLKITNDGTKSKAHVPLTKEMPSLSELPKIPIPNKPSVTIGLSEESQNPVHDLFNKPELEYPDASLINEPTKDHMDYNEPNFEIYINEDDCTLLKCMYYFEDDDCGVFTDTFVEYNQDEKLPYTEKILQRQLERLSRELIKLKVLSVDIINQEPVIYLKDNKDVIYALKKIPFGDDPNLYHSHYDFGLMITNDEEIRRVYNLK